MANSNIVIKKVLEDEAWVVYTAETGQRGLIEAATRRPDLIILDLGLPDSDGLEIINDIRTWSKLPIIVLSARSNEQDKIQALNYGADDYLTKPFYLEELKMRIQALLKRSGKFNENVLTYGNITVNLATNSTMADEEEVELLGKEFDLLVYFLQNQNVILPKTQIFDRIWGFDSDTTISVVEVYVSKIRKKLKGTAFGENLQTLRSVGYILKDVE